MKRLFEKWKKMPDGVRASLAFFFSGLVTKGIGYIITPIYTRLLSPEEYGQVSVYLTWMEVLGIIAMFCFSYGVFNNGMLDFKEDRDNFSFSLLMLSNLITIGLGIVVAMLYPLVGKYIGIDIPLLLLMFMVFLFQPAYSFWVARQRYELKYKKTVALSIFSALFTPLLAIAGILLLPNNRLYGRLFGGELALLSIYIVFYIYWAVKNKGKVNTKYWRYAFFFNFPLIPHYLSTRLLSSSDKIMISHIVGDSAAAYYSVAYTIASVVLIVWTSANSSLIPYTYEKCEKKDYASISRATLPILCLFAGVCIFLIMLAPEIVAFIAPSNYKEAVYAIPPVIGGVFFQVHYYMYANVLYYYKKPKYVMLGSVVSTVLNLILNYIFINMFGYIAAAYTTLVCYLLQAAIDYFAMRKTVKNSVYNMKWIGLLSLLVAVVSVFSRFVYRFSIIRYSLLALLCIAAVLFRKKIIGILFAGKRRKDET